MGTLFMLVLCVCGRMQTARLFAGALLGCSAAVGFPSVPHQCSSAAPACKVGIRCVLYVNNHSLEITVFAA